MRSIKRFFLGMLARARCIGIQHVVIACTVLSIPATAFACWRVHEEHVDALAYSEMHELRSAILDYEGHEAGHEPVTELKVLYNDTPSEKSADGPLFRARIKGEGALEDPWGHPYTLEKRGDERVLCSSGSPSSDGCKLAIVVPMPVRD